MTNPSSYRIAIDIGGTFTDVVILDEATHELRVAKVSTTPSDRAVGFFNGIEQALQAAGGEPRQVREIVHGSTVATNAVLEGKGGRMGLITTLGFRDILEIGRAYIPGIFTNYLRWQKPERLVPLERVREVPERLAVDGSIIQELDEAPVRAAVQELLDQEIESLAIALLHSYVNPVHERRIEEIARAMAPDLFISRSSATLPEYREYERTMTTVLNAYVMPAVDRYLSRIENGLGERGLPAEITMVRSDAGVMSLAAALERPVNTVLSGPAGGVRGASAVAAAAGFPNVVSMDMGGTSTDVCLSTEAELALSTDAWISHYPIKVPIIDITTIGAGGGSLAYITPSGALQVGPQSAGADPGPACYGRGGDRPTVTDANLVLGRLPLQLAGGELTLDREASCEAVRRHVADPLGLSTEEAAAGIIRIVDEHMLGALRVVSVQRGLDPRELVLVPFGGAGPIHGGQLATLAGINTMMVPALPGVLSALGFLLADVKQVFTQTKVGVIGELDADSYNAELARLIDAAMTWLVREDVPEAERSVEVALDLRYKGQAYELPIAVTAPLDAHGWECARERFHAEHRRRYGFDQAFANVEVVTLRVTAVGALPKPRFQPLPEQDEDASSAMIDRAPVYFDGGWMETPRYDRDRLGHGNRVDGPAVVVQRDCTTVIHPGQSLRVDQLANLIVTTGA